jgi:hypothetical protein
MVQPDANTSCNLQTVPVYSDNRGRGQYVKLYQFIDPQMCRGLICIAPNTAVCSAFTQRLFVRTFGGYVVYRDTATDQIYLGVHRKRMVSRFRRLIREKGIDFSVCERLPDTFVRGGSRGGKLDWVT